MIPRKCILNIAMWSVVLIAVALKLFLVYYAANFMLIPVISSLLTGGKFGIVESLVVLCTISILYYLTPAYTELVRSKVSETIAEAVTEERLDSEEHSKIENLVLNAVAIISGLLFMLEVFAINYFFI